MASLSWTYSWSHVLQGDMRVCPFLLGFNLGNQGEKTIMCLPRSTGHSAGFGFNLAMSLSQVPFYQLFLFGRVPLLT